jgi:YidC/Oxa1 family membrane protein insertase
MREDNKNLLLAIVLSGIVLIAWNYFYGVPTMQQQQRAAQSPAVQQTQPPVPGQPSPSQAGGPSAPVPGTVPSTPAVPAIETREAALQRSPRVTVETPSLRGSINLRGGRIDDVALKNYRETVDPRSPNIVLFAPSGSQNPYYAEFGWVGTDPAALPTPDTVWTADAQTLTPERR